MYSLIVFATQWGTKYGGINSFNRDLLSAFAFAYHQDVEVICLIGNGNDPDATSHAAKAGVRLIPLFQDQDPVAFGRDEGLKALDVLAHVKVSLDPQKTVWLGHDRITGEAAVVAARAVGSRSAVIHHMSYDHYESYAENSESAHRKTQQQLAIFRAADIVLAVGPLLWQAAKDLVDKPVCMLIPGLAQVEPRAAPSTFVAFLSGRLGDNAAPIKQGQLGIAAFARAERNALQNGMPEALCKQPKLLIRGVDFETLLENAAKKRNPEEELKRFAEEYGEKVINVHALPFTDDRDRLFWELAGSSVALMPSWHEGFGLVAWEAIAAGVPLILSKNSGVYRLLEEKEPGSEIGYVHSLEVHGTGAAPYFRPEDLEITVKAINEVAKNPSRERLKASRLRTMFMDYTWTACAEQVVECLGWKLQKGGIPDGTPADNVAGSESPEDVPLRPDDVAFLKMIGRQWRPNAGMADSQLLRPEEELLPFDSARQPDLDELDRWLDDVQFPHAIRLVTGAGGEGKSRLAIELCHRRSSLGWIVGFLDSAIPPAQINSNWAALAEKEQPILIVVDYAETRQPAVLELVKAVLHIPHSSPVRILLLARDGGEWWDDLPSKEPECEALLSGYATTGPFRLGPLYTSEFSRRIAFNMSLQAFSKVLGGRLPKIEPDLLGEHFKRPLYVQIAALLALYGENPTTAEGLTRSLLNHERRYWARLLEYFSWPEPDALAERLLALSTLAGGFLIARDAEKYWQNAGGITLRSADFNLIFRALATLYPGTQGLEAFRPDLLGEALVAQALLRSDGEAVLGAVFDSSASAHVRRNALTVVARLSTYRFDLDEAIIDALGHELGRCWRDLTDVSRETVSRLPELAKQTFARLSTNGKNQVAGVLRSAFRDDSVQLADLHCVVTEYQMEKTRERFLRTRKRVAEYAAALLNYAVALARNGQVEQAIPFDEEAVQRFKQLCGQDKRTYQSAYALSLDNFALHLAQMGKSGLATVNAKQALEIRKPLASFDRSFENDYASSLYHYSTYLAEAEQHDEALTFAEESLRIRERLASKDPERFTADYATSLHNFANRLRDATQIARAVDLIGEALRIRSELARKRPDRFEHLYANSLDTYASMLCYLGKFEDALKRASQAIEIRQRLVLKNPERFEWHYAESLDTHTTIYAAIGDWQRAIDFSERSLALHLRLFNRNADRFVGNLFISVLRAKFLGWLYHQPTRQLEGPNVLGVHLRELFDLLPTYEKPINEVFWIFVAACCDEDPILRENAFDRVLSLWDTLTVSQKLRGEDDWICMAAWYSHFNSPKAPPAWESEWRRFIQRRGAVPKWMLDLASRLGFSFPSSA